ncbi:hypothetical protein [Limnohabitans sp.]|jgi:hypothetical protein|uniref:hypothetical protein n=1 Tax=Limnohabitans sp. TaxID=1907725 RepID=UPI0037BFBDBF
MPSAAIPYPLWRAQRGHPFLILVCHLAARDDKQLKAMTVNCLGCHANEPQGIFYRFPVRLSSKNGPHKQAWLLPSAADF